MMKYHDTMQAIQYHAHPKRKTSEGNTIPGKWGGGHRWENFKKQVRSDNDASVVDILRHFGTF